MNETAQAKNDPYVLDEDGIKSTWYVMSEILDEVIFETTDEEFKPERFTHTIGINDGDVIYIFCLKQGNEYWRMVDSISKVGFDGRVSLFLKGFYRAAKYRLLEFKEHCKSK